ncbi:MAG: LPXTG cell wall anchor domain-containing protein [Ruminococcus sp.]|nr:LPXTG cell wall anchor domain-containing protein [Ruminococcus sp.]
MKTTKKISAVLLAVLFILSMIPFAVSAASHTLTVKLEYPDYTVNVYQIATVKDDGTYLITNDNAPAAVKNQVSAAETSTVALFNALEADTATTYPSSGTMTTTSAATSQTKDFTLDPGLYYVKFTALSSKNATYGNSLVVIDNQNVTLDIKSEGKVTEGEASVHKKIVEDGSEITSTTTGSLDTVEFKLSATRTGSAKNKLSEYEIRDVMDSGLSASDVNITSVEYEDGTKITDYEPLEAFQDTNKAGENVNYTFAVAIGSETLNGDAFYTHSNIIVKYTTKLSASAVQKTKYYNHDDLYFKNKSNQVSKESGDTVDVVTYKPQLKKYVAGGTTPLADAKFKLYKSDKETVIGYGKSDADGNVEFYKEEALTNKLYVKKGTYWAKEYEAPANYNLNNSWVQLSEDSTNYLYNGTVYNTPVKLPKTGDVGTMAITLTGIGLILASGVMFIVLRKRTSK